MQSPGPRAPSPGLTMLAPLLVAALCAAASAQFGPPPAQGCALIIPGPAKSSLFDHANNVFGGRPVPFDSQNTCITYEAVNVAFQDAKQRVGLPPVRGKFSGLDVGHLGTVIHETARYLAKQYALSKDAIANGLPLIDTTKSSIEPYCPPFLMTPKCEIQRYRSVEGICNNLEQPHWGAAMNGHHRWIAPDYADGVSAPRASITGYPLPSTRMVSINMHKDEGYHDHAVTILLVIWGQFIDHDITLTAETKVIHDTLLVSNVKLFYSISDLYTYFQGGRGFTIIFFGKLNYFYSNSFSTNTWLEIEKISAKIQ